VTEPTQAAVRASRSSFYTAMRIMPKAEREAMFAIYKFCRLVDEILTAHFEKDPSTFEMRLEEVRRLAEEFSAK